MKQEILLDASALIKSACMLRLKRIVVDGYSDALPFNDTLYGSAVHLFNATMCRTGGNFGEATSATQALFSRPKQIRDTKKHLTEIHLLKTCFDYWQYFHPKDNFRVLTFDDKPCIEMDFKNLFYEDDEYIVYLTGTIDKFGQIADGAYCVGDYKTHSLWSVNKNGKDNAKYEIEKFFRKFELSLQLAFYVFNLKLKAQQNPDSELARICQQPIGSFIDGIFLSSSEPTKFVRSSVKIWSDGDMDMIRRLVLGKILQLLKILKAEKETGVAYTDLDGMICGACSDQQFLCQFFDVCAARDEMARAFLLKDKFVRKQYNPLMFSK